MRQLVRFLLKSSRGSFALAVAAGLVGGLGGVGLIALVISALRPDAPPAARLAPAFLALCLVTVVARVVAQVALIRVAQGSIARLVRHLCGRILALPLKRFEGHEPGELLAILTEDVSVLTAALSGLPLLFINLTVVLGCFLNLAFVSPAVLICTAAFTGPAVFMQHALTGRGHRLLSRARAHQDALAGHFRALIEGFKDLKLNRDRRQEFLTDSIKAASARVRDGNTAGLSVFAAVGGWGQFLYFGFIGFLLFGLPLIVAVPREALAASVLTMLFAISPLDAVLAYLPVLGRAGASMNRVEALGLTLDAEADDAREAATIPDRPGPLDAPLILRGVTYTHVGERGGEGFTLGPIDLTVRPGEILFLVGGNGSGKTTLIKLLTGLYPPDAGTIRHGSKIVDGLSLDTYRRLFTAVFADGFIFPALHGPNPPARDARAAALLSALGLDGVVGIKDGAFTTTRLSSGQLKRLALAAACLEDRPVLVLDEWASYQDPRFKRVYYREILPSLKALGKTLVVISHDDAYFDAADRVVHLTDGAFDRPPPGPLTPPIHAQPHTQASAIHETEL